MDYSTSTALITGASSGVGAQFAVDLAARGADLVLVARRHDRLEELRHRLESDHGSKVTIVPLDLAEPHPAAALRRALEERGIRITMLVNNAGLGSSSSLLSAAPDVVHDQIAVNISALVDLTREFLPDLIASGNGVLVNVASMAALQPIPGLAVYAASKTFVHRFTSAIAYEVRDEPVKVLTLVPGATRTEFWQTAGMVETGTSFETPADVVATALTALDRRRTPLVAISGPRNRAMARLLALLPLSERMILNAASRARAASNPGPVAAG
ncbi:short-subunit dehydrogenase [Microbacteriaceae bacterium SG_E_30_P1]|uniref:Short-subunit dehydrogenase n=1 Tax=Antiquaquibacter oligotrophicus TaxID=2880260 RepID=A0ABT6KSA8_9MICO|nr:SDR family NAD(P)-dependent oxidoreductase [Antiquaquibacter oligotrophicus]MDH6182064.1 short-subunit dehydrogenase [Antiquaquibacter oligotrophicus]UDF12269.1 SDR family NAD(P)-dependent oxidoreductase [Antiquaquibacter oligotrophicus]